MKIRIFPLFARTVSGFRASPALSITAISAVLAGTHLMADTSFTTGFDSLGLDAVLTQTHTEPGNTLMLVGTATFTGIDAEINRRSYVSTDESDYAVSANNWTATIEVQNSGFTGAQLFFGLGTGTTVDFDGPIYGTPQGTTAAEPVSFIMMYDPAFNNGGDRSVGTARKQSNEGYWAGEVNKTDAEFDTIVGTTGGVAGNAFYRYSMAYDALAQTLTFDVVQISAFGGTVISSAVGNVRVVSLAGMGYDSTNGKIFFGGNNSTFDNLAVNVTVVPPTSGTWTNTAGGQWGAAGNWLSNIVASGSGSTADFSTLNITADTTVDLDSVRMVGNLVFGDTDTSSAAGWTLAGTALTLSGSTPTITVNALATAKTATISAVVTGSAGLSKSGFGTLTLTGANAYTNDTTINAGTLEIGDGGTTGTLGSGAVFIDSGAFLSINRSNDYGTGSSQVFSGAGTIIKKGTGDLVFYGAPDHVNVQGIDNVVVSNGLIRTDYYGQWNSNLNLTASGSGKFELWSSNTSLGTLNGDGTVQNTKYFDRATTLTVAAGSFSGTITDSGITSGGAGTGDTRLSLIKSSAGTLTLSGTISYGGNTTVEGGTLSIGNGVSTTNLADSSTVSIASGATMHLNFTGSDTVGALEIAGAGPLPAGIYNSLHPIYGSYFTGSGSLVVPVTATPYEIWANSFEPDIGLPAADDDNDGVTNFAEYAFGLLPNSGSSVNPISAQLDKSDGTFSYTRRTGSGLTYSVWYSENLDGWTKDIGILEGTPVPSGDNETVEVTLSVDPLPAKLFIQVRAD
jgi:autotransporter-associated beta strand protein